MRIGLDIMGGDFAPEVTVKGAILAQNQLPSDVELVLIGKKSAIIRHLEDESADNSKFEIVNADEVIEMADSPTRAFSSKPNSSISIGFKCLAQGEIDGFCSTGNSGAMLVGAMRSVSTVPGLYRPCITTAIPQENGSVTILLDVGINADCKPDVLYQFAMVGSIYAKYIYNTQNPRVGLLNIGEEEKKGNLLAQATHEMMKGTNDFNFIGNAEIVQRFRGIPHNIKVGLAADDDADKGGIAGHGDFLWLIRLWGRYRPSIRSGAFGEAGNYRFPPALSKGRQQSFNHGVCYNPQIGSILVSISPGVEGFALWT